jgi:aspartyl-tRNA(Asn)/glutamyl-tRNA(Gln) amidotransferase subunit C
MEITDEIVNRVAALAKLEFNAEEKEAIKHDMSRIVAFCEKLNEVDMENVEPLIFMTDEVNAFREDVAKLEITHDEALMNAPEKDSDYFKVPKFLDR